MVDRPRRRSEIHLAEATLPKQAFDLVLQVRLGTGDHLRDAQELGA